MILGNIKKSRARKPHSKSNRNFAVLLVGLVLISYCRRTNANTFISEIPRNAKEQYCGMIEESERCIPVVGISDVIIVGGGIAGVVAALKADESGHSVILLDSHNYFGSEITSTYLSKVAKDLPTKSTALARELCDSLRRLNILTDDQIDPHALRFFLHKKIGEAQNIRVCFFSTPCGIVSKNGRIQGVEFVDMNGRKIVLGKSVIDATEDAKVSKSAGVNFLRQVNGNKVARRFIIVPKSKLLPIGKQSVSPQLGIKDNSIFIYDRFPGEVKNERGRVLRPESHAVIELAIDVQIGEDIAGDISMVLAQTLKKCFELQDYFFQKGIILPMTSQTYPYSISPEMWIDEMPVVLCQEQFSDESIALLDFINQKALIPVGIEGLIVAGRTVSMNPKINNFQSLLSIGELAGKTAIDMVHEYDAGEFPDLVESLYKTQDISEGLQVKEILEGSEFYEKYLGIQQSSKQLPIKEKFDVLVVGGGTSGALAAIAAARQGASVAIIESMTVLGGTGTLQIGSYYWGTPWKSLLRQELGDLIHLKKSGGDGGLEKVNYSGEHKKYALQELALRAGVKIYYQSIGCGVIVDGFKVKGVVVENMSGRQAFLADVVIDATGYASIAVAAGAKFVKGRETDGLLHLFGDEIRCPTNIKDISATYKNYLADAINMNPRESRQIIGDYMVTFEDAIHEQLFPDVICRWRSNYDSYFPNSANQSKLAQNWTSILGLFRRPIMGSIPYRSLLPQGLDNILVTSKSYSIDHDALISGRMSPDLEHLGEATGIAAALACDLGISPRDIPIEELQNKLVHLGIIRKEDVPNQTINEGPSDEILYRQDYWKNERKRQFPPKASSLEEYVQRLGTEIELDAMVQLYLAGSKTIPLLQPLLRSVDSRIQEDAAIVLGLLGDKSAVPILLKILNERNTRTFEYTLQNATSRKSLPLFWSSVILLGRFGEKEAVPMILELLEASPPPELLRELHRANYHDNMFESITTCPPTLVSFIIVALGQIGDPIAIDKIRPFLKVSNLSARKRFDDLEIAWGIQTNAAWSLAQMGDLSGIQAITELINSDQSLVRNYAVRLLETIIKKQREMDRHILSAYTEINK